MQKQLMCVVWPAFLAACAMEMLVFGLFDPHDLRWFGHNMNFSSQGIYSLAFFAFWTISAASSWLSSTLGLSAKELNQESS